MYHDDEMDCLPLNSLPSNNYGGDSLYPADLGSVACYRVGNQQNGDGNNTGDERTELDYHLMTSASVDNGDDTVDDTANNYGYDHDENNMVALVPDDSDFLDEHGFGGDYFDDGRYDDDDIGAFIKYNNAPPTIEKCWIVNRAYQTELEMFKEVLEERLMANREMQEELLSSETSTVDHVYPNSLLKFLAPYFRDNKHYLPDDNEDTKNRKASGCINIFYTRLKKPWKDQDKLDLKSAVETNVLKQIMEPYTRKENCLRKEIEILKVTNDSQDVLESRLEALDSIRQDIEAISYSNYIPPREHCDDIDWLEVSQRCSPIYSEFDCEVKWINELHPNINHEKWTAEEESNLRSLVKDGHPDWENIALKLDTKRCAWQCCQKFQSDLNEKIVRAGQFTFEESRILKNLVRQSAVGDYIPWHQVAYFMEGRSLAQIKHFWNKTQCSRRGAKWNELEDKVLLAAVKKFGTRCWKVVADYIPGRTNRQCRERYMMRLGIKDRKIADWTFNEDLELISIAPNLKFRWVEMMAHILGRNSRQIAARYDMIEKRHEIAKLLKSSKDLQDLVPRKKATRMNNIISELDLPEGQTIEEFLREGRKDLQKAIKTDTYRPRITRPGTGGRKRKAEKEELIEKELVERFSFYSLMGKISQPNKLLVRAGQESMLLDVLRTMLRDFFSHRLPEEPHLLAQTVSSVLIKHVIGLNPDFRNYSLPIFPPNIVTTSSYQVLLFMRHNLRQQLDGCSFDLDYQPFLPSYQTLMKYLISLYFWPCVLSTQYPASSSGSSVSLLINGENVEMNQSPSTSNRPRRSTKKKRKSSNINIGLCNEAREKQRHLFSTYETYLTTLCDK